MFASLRSRAAVVLVAAIGLTGCAQHSPSTAFTVNGRSVSMGELETATEGCARVTPEVPASSVTRQVREWALDGLVADAVARRAGITLDDEKARAVVRESGQDNLLRNPDCARVAMSGAKLVLAAGTVGEKGAEMVKQLDISVNPRIGAWDAQQLRLAHYEGRLSELAPQTDDSGRQG